MVISMAVVAANTVNDLVCINKFNSLTIWIFCHVSPKSNPVHKSIRNIYKVAELQTAVMI